MPSAVDATDPLPSATARGCLAIWDGMGNVTPRAYLLCGTPRTGSTLFCGLLRSTGVAGRPESYFRAPDEQAWAKRWGPAGRHGSINYKDYVQAAIREGSTANGVFGARIMWGTMDELVAKLSVVHPDLAEADYELLTRAFGPTRFVHLWRDDIVAQAVSWARAEQSGYWQTGDTPTRQPRFDFQLIDDLVRTIRQHNEAWREWFAAHGITPHSVAYEHLTADMAGVVQETLSFLGLDIPPDRKIVPRHERQVNDLNLRWAARYRALAYSGSADASTARF